MMIAEFSVSRAVVNAADFAKMFDELAPLGVITFASMRQAQTDEADIAPPAEKPKTTRAKKEPAAASPPTDASSAPGSSTPSTAAVAADAPSEPRVDTVELRALITTKIAAAAANRILIQDLIKQATPDGKLSSVPAEKLPAFRAAVESM